MLPRGLLNPGPAHDGRCRHIRGELDVEQAQVVYRAGEPGHVVQENARKIPYMCSKQADQPSLGLHEVGFNP